MKTETPKHNHGRYSRNGKIQITIDSKEFFNEVLKNQNILGQEKTAFVCTVFYLGIRVSEALRLRREDFTVKGDRLFVNVGKRLKHGLETPPLQVKTDRPFVSLIVSVVKATPKHERVWKFHRTTAWRFIAKNFSTYPHFYRLNRITTFFDDGYTINKVKTWTGLTLKALDFYVGLSSISEMGDSL